MYQSWWRGLAKVMILRRTVLALICPFIHDPFDSSFADPCSHTNIRDQSFLCITCIYYSPYITCTCSGTDFRTSRVSTVVSPHFDSVLTTNDIHNKSLTSSNILRYRGFSVCVFPTTFAFCSVDKAFPRTFSVACLKQEPKQGECIILYFNCRFVQLTFPQLSVDENVLVFSPMQYLLFPFLSMA